MTFSAFLAARVATYHNPKGGAHISSVAGQMIGKTNRLERGVRPDAGREIPYSPNLKKGVLSAKQG
jgi:hypothetical protein